MVFVFWYLLFFIRFVELFEADGEKERDINKLEEKRWYKHNEINI